MWNSRSYCLGSRSYAYYMVGCGTVEIRQGRVWNNSSYCLSGIKSGCGTVGDPELTITSGHRTISDVTRQDK